MYERITDIYSVHCFLIILTKEIILKWENITRTENISNNVKSLYFLKIEPSCILYIDKIFLRWCNDNGSTSNR